MKGFSRPPRIAPRARQAGRGGGAPNDGVPRTALHRAGIIHGDLTTSNMIVRDAQIIMIDFSLGGKDDGLEARGVDLHLLKEALGSAHARAASYYQAALKGYRKTMGRAAEDVIAKVKEIESRGRYT